MNKEYDLMNELGRGNWVDSVAGEAVVLGAVIRNPELEVLGTNLARVIREIPYDSDEFYRVQAGAEHVREAIERIKKERDQTIFIDDIYEGKDKNNKSSYAWEYGLLFAGGSYQIQLILPTYIGRSVLCEENKALAEKVVRETYSDASFESYKKTVVEAEYETQVFKTTSYWNEEGVLLRRIIDHDHEGFNYRGWHEVFYFPDFEQAVEAWLKLKTVVTSDRRK